MTSTQPLTVLPSADEERPLNEIICDHVKIAYIFLEFGGDAQVSLETTKVANLGANKLMHLFFLVNRDIARVYSVFIDGQGAFSVRDITAQAKWRPNAMDVSKY